MKRIVSFIVVFTLVMGGMTHVQAQSKAVEKAEKKLEREAKKEAREAKDAIMDERNSTLPCKLSPTSLLYWKPTPYNQ